MPNINPYILNDMEREPLTWHHIEGSRHTTSSSNLSNSWNWSSWYSKRSPKVMEQIILETALLILKWGLKGCPGGGRRDGAFRLVCVYFLLRVCSTWHVTSWVQNCTRGSGHSTWCGLTHSKYSVNTCSQTSDLCLKSVMCLIPISWCLIPELWWGRVTVSCSLLYPQFLAQGWAQDRYR